MENKTEIKKDLKIIFFGTGPLAESTLYALYKNDYIPQYVVTKPDSAVGRKQIITPPMIKKWCEIKDIKVLQPEKLKEINLDSPLLQEYDLAIVASYGNIIPENILNIPKYGFLNVHPSDLPAYRGPSPIESALLAGDRKIVVSIMKLDAGMDTGPVLIKQTIDLQIIDTAESVELKAGQVGGELLSNCIEHYINSNLIPKDQDNSKATICKFIEKSQGEISLADDIENIKNKWRAFYPWPGIYFFVKHKTNNEEKDIRVKIVEFDLLQDDLEECIKKVRPEGKSDMTYSDFKRGYLENQNI